MRLTMGFDVNRLSTGKLPGLLATICSEARDSGAAP